MTKNFDHNFAQYFLGFDNYLSVAECSFNQFTQLVHENGDQVIYCLGKGDF